MIINLNRKIMELLSIIQMALYIFSGMLAVVLVISYISYKMKNKSKPVLEEKLRYAVRKADPGYLPVQNIAPLPVLSPVQTYQMPQMQRYARPHVEMSAMHSSYTDYKRPVENRRLMVVNTIPVRHTAEVSDKEPSSSFNDLDLRTAVFFR
jgi:hypothetical protein